eukprot:759129-Hanusia_phi.AAC.6
MDDAASSAIISSISCSLPVNPSMPDFSSTLPSISSSPAVAKASRMRSTSRGPREPPSPARPRRCRGCGSKVQTYGHGMALAKL